MVREKRIRISFGEMRRKKKLEERAAFPYKPKSQETDAAQNPVSFPSAWSNPAARVTWATLAWFAMLRLPEFERAKQRRNESVDPLLSPCLSCIYHICLINTKGTQASLWQGCFHQGWQTHRDHNRAPC